MLARTPAPSWRASHYRRHPHRSPCPSKISSRAGETSACAASSQFSSSGTTFVAHDPAVITMDPAIVLRRSLALLAALGLTALPVTLFLQSLGSDGFDWLNLLRTLLLALCC